MPTCNRCDARIFFIGFEPRADGQIPKSIPLDLEPDPERGTVAIYEIPQKWPGSGRIPAEHNARISPISYGNRIYGEAAAAFVRQGGALYRVHFDSCKNPYVRKRK
jgi:hypothetical protein